MYSRSGVKAMIRTVSTIRIKPDEEMRIKTFRRESLNESRSSNELSFMITSLYLVSHFLFSTLKLSLRLNLVIIDS